MKFKIHFEHQDGTEDNFVVSADTIEEIKDLAYEGLKQRNGKLPWSEEL